MIVSFCQTGLKTLCQTHGARGADASYAWVSLWCGPEFGWIDLDPTNDMLICDDHIIVARGRDYSDVSPVDGVFVGSGTDDLLVNVDVIPVG